MEEIKLRDSLSVYGSKISPRMFLDNNGQLIIKDAILARTGSYQYLESDIKQNGDKDKIVEVYRTPEEVFDPASIASFENKPLCDDHPDEDVCGDNYTILNKGFLRDVHRGEGELNNCLVGNIVVTDPDLIDTIRKNKKRDLSLGYDTQIVLGDDGKYYMTKIRGNHIALVEDGRAGIATIRDSNIKNNLGGLKPVKKVKTNSKMDAFIHRLFDENDVVEVEEVDDLTEAAPEETNPEVEEETSVVKDDAAMMDILTSIDTKLGSILEALQAKAEPVVDEAPEMDKPVETEKTEKQPVEETVVSEEVEPQDEDIKADAEGFYDEADDIDGCEEDEDEDNDDDMQAHDAKSVYRKFTKVGDSKKRVDMQEEISKAFRDRYNKVGGKN